MYVSANGCSMNNKWGTYVIPHLHISSHLFSLRFWRICFLWALGNTSPTKINSHFLSLPNNQKLLFLSSIFHHPKIHSIQMHSKDDCNQYPISYIVQLIERFQQPPINKKLWFVRFDIRDDNFSPLRLTHPFPCFAPCRFSPPCKGGGAGMG